MISADYGDGVIRWSDGSDLDGPFWHIHEDEREFTVAHSYTLKGTGRIVHRGVHVTLKQGLGIQALEGRLG